MSTFDNQSMSIGCVGKLGHLFGFLRHYILRVLDVCFSMNLLRIMGPLILKENTGAVCFYNFIYYIPNDDMKTIAPVFSFKISGSMIRNRTHLSLYIS